VRISIDAAAGGALIGKSIEAAKALLEEMTSNNYHWSSDRATPQRGGGKHSVDAVTLLASRVDALAQRLEKVTSSPSPVGFSGSTIEVYAICEICGVQGHTSVECYNDPSAIEHVNAYQDYQPPPQHPSHLTAYNKGGEKLLQPPIQNPCPTSTKCHALTRISTTSTLYTYSTTSTINSSPGKHDSVVHSSTNHDQ